MAESIAPFPPGYQGAVSLSFDDGLQSQCDVAVPLMEDRGLRATFYVSPRDKTPGRGDWREFLAPWQQVAERGHEIGNHSLTHTCSRAMWLEPCDRCLEDLAVADIEQDVVEAERRLEAVFGASRRSFAYPCYEDFVGVGTNRQSYVPVIAKHFIAGRSKSDYPNSPLTCDLHYLTSYPCERMSGAEMVGLAARAISLGRWVILTFHGIDEGHLPVWYKDLREVCDFLTENRDIWTAPVVTVAQNIIKWRNATSQKQLTEESKWQSLRS